MKYYVVKMSNGEHWGVPAEHIAKNYADYRAECGADWDRVYQKMMGCYEDGDWEFDSWAQNDMDWYDVVERAVLLATVKPDVSYSDEWMNSDCRHWDTEKEGQYEP